MTLRSLSCEEVREVDRIAIEKYSIPGIVLMENAGKNATELLIGLQIQGPVLIVCGKGNNGGDGFVIARHLDNRKIPVSLFLTCQPTDLTGDARINCQIIEKSGIPIQLLGTEEGFFQFQSALSEAGCVVDALLGTGISGEVRGIYRDVIEEINRSSCPVFSVDIPSGLDCDSGIPLGTAIKANWTVSFVARKKGYDQSVSIPYTGEVFVAEIGAPRRAIEEAIGD